MAVLSDGRLASGDYGVLRITGVYPRAQRVVPEKDVIDDDAVLLDGSFFERHEVEHERYRLGDASRQPDAGMIGGAQNSFLVLGQRSRLDARMEGVGVNLGDVNGEPLFQLRASHDGVAFGIVIGLLYDVGKSRTLESPGAS